MPKASAPPTYQSRGGSVLAEGAAAAPETRGAALEFLRNLAMELSKGSMDLPCFPDVVIRIRHALANPTTTTEKTVAIVGNEPRLAARLLQTANSAAFNTTGKPLTDLRSAITRLGHQLVQSAAMAYAVQQMKNAAVLRPIAKPLNELWRDCILVASVSQAVAERTQVRPDEAFLTGLLHGIGRLYIMVRAVGQAEEFGYDQTFLLLVADWHASIGKAVLENWGFAEEMCNAVGEQDDRERRKVRGNELSDVLAVGVAIAGTLKNPASTPKVVSEVSAFQHVGLTAEDCAAVLAQAKQHLGSLHDALGA
ncbi:MAG: HDOD domain-containing protein [Steroidobacteraceae bacterium]|jgi:HD-like signal output (HDOD) protein